MFLRAAQYTCTPIKSTFKRSACIHNDNFTYLKTDARESDCRTFTHSLIHTHNLCLSPTTLPLSPSIALSAYRSLSASVSVCLSLSLSLSLHSLYLSVCRSLSVCLSLSLSLHSLCLPISLSLSLHSLSVSLCLSFSVSVSIFAEKDCLHGIIRLQM